ncbi:YsnF/AvaK domain-containing protein [Planomicrobium sp. CPCC 101079]|uniref:YsnF/AvaK domain-containing protein n=1 Tax=Planomicrobium sp. CPCC 101079 TaxID=2599618 RepID=UPI0011B388EC|nr:YsnF/AvaK domain-containing protein [Planomicrobium sp. CPCC 101079]TWT09233.1 YsnF/AvaK domain-containing protein [Planomicrobium sp. CPCC 101079]
MARKENTFIGVFDNQAEVLSKVTELKAQGYNESDMYVVGRDNNSFSMVHNQTDVHVDATEEKKKQGFLGKFMTALSDDSSLSAFNGMGLERYEEKEYRDQVRNGKLVLYADSDYSETYEQYSANFTTDYSNSSGIDQTAPIETNASFSQSSSAGSASDTDIAYDTSSINANSTSGAGFTEEATSSSSSSTSDADSEFGKSISASGSSFESESGTAGNSFGSSSHSGSSFKSDAGTTGSSTRDTTGRTFGSTSDAGSTFESASATSGSAGSTSNANAGDYGTVSGATEEESLRLHEERLSVDKERVQTGEVNVGKHVVEENQSIDVPVEREEVYVERHAVNEEATGSEAFEENDTIHVPVSEERVNVTKKDVVAEEIVISKRKVQDTEQVNETVRREVADIDEDTTDSVDKNENKRS